MSEQSDVTLVGPIQRKTEDVCDTFLVHEVAAETEVETTHISKATPRNKQG